MIIQTKIMTGCVVDTHKEKNSHCLTDAAAAAGSTVPLMSAGLSLREADPGILQQMGQVAADGIPSGKSQQSISIY
jgi:hypothetical protein